MRELQQILATGSGLHSLQFIGDIWIITAGNMHLLPEASRCLTNCDFHLLTLVENIAAERRLITPSHFVIDGGVSD